jgi:hypothetical protein
VPGWVGLSALKNSNSTDSDRSAVEIRRSRSILILDFGLVRCNLSLCAVSADLSENFRTHERCGVEVAIKLVLVTFQLILVCQEWTAYVYAWRKCWRPKDIIINDGVDVPGGSDNAQ